MFSNYNHKIIGAEHNHGCIISCKFFISGGDAAKLFESVDSLLNSVVFTVDFTAKQTATWLIRESWNSLAIRGHAQTTRIPIVYVRMALRKAISYAK